MGKCLVVTREDGFHDPCHHSYSLCTSFSDNPRAWGGGCIYGLISSYSLAMEVQHFHRLLFPGSFYTLIHCSPFLVKHTTEFFDFFGIVFPVLSFKLTHNNLLMQKCFQILIRIHSYFL